MRLMHCSSYHTRLEICQKVQGLKSRLCSPMLQLTSYYLLEHVSIPFVAMASLAALAGACFAGIGCGAGIVKMKTVAVALLGAQEPT